MNIVTIPQKLAKKGDLVMIPRKEYEELSALRKLMSVVKPTREEARIIRRGEREIREGKYVEWRKLKKELARSHN